MTKRQHLSRLLKDIRDSGIKGPLLSMPEAAAVIGITRVAVFQAIKRGKLEAYRAGPHVVVPERCALRYKESRRPPGWPKGKLRPKRPR